MEEFLESFPVFCAVNGVRRSAEDFHALPFERNSKLQGSLTSKLDNNALGFFGFDNVQYIFYGKGLKVKPV